MQSACGNRKAKLTSFGVTLVRTLFLLYMVTVSKTSWRFIHLTEIFVYHMWTGTWVFQSKVMISNIELTTIPFFAARPLYTQIPNCEPSPFRNYNLGLTSGFESVWSKAHMSPFWKSPDHAESVVSKRVKCRLVPN